MKEKQEARMPAMAATFEYIEVFYNRHGFTAASAASAPNSSRRADAAILTPRHVDAPNENVHVLRGSCRAGVHATDPGRHRVAADHGVANPGRVERGGGLAESLLDALDGHEVRGQAHRTDCTLPRRKKGRAQARPFELLRPLATYRVPPVRVNAISIILNSLPPLGSIPNISKVLVSLPVVFWTSRRVVGFFVIGQV
jgi:hypothetical protein